MAFIWVVSIIATLIIADQKRLGVGGYFVLALLTGPLAVIIVLLVSSQNTGTVNNLQDARKQLNDLKYSLSALQQKINSLELFINKLAGQEAVVKEKIEIRDFTEDKVKKSERIDDRVVPLSLEKKEMDAGLEKTADMELNFGRNWLNKIGIVIFTLGMGFLISYTFKYFGPFFKIIFGYLVGAILFFIGFKLETKEKLVNFGRALLGGGWALVYFTTYAMHHFAASRLIESQVIDLCLLALVVAGMMAHVLRYRSEGMMSLALFAAYLTSTFGQITEFTILSNLLLGALVLFLVYKFQWVKTFILGILLTYGIHYVWVVPNLMASAREATLFGMATPDYHLFMNFIFLTSYWLIFLAGAHLAKTLKDPQITDTLSAANFGNIALYSILSYPLILKLFYTQRFAVVFCAGIAYLMLALLMKRRGHEKLYISDVVAAVFAITFSISLKFLPTETLMVWLVEIPFLLFVGLSFKEKIFKCLSYALSVIVAIGLTLMCFEWRPEIHFLGLIWTWREFMSFGAAISMAACFCLTRRSKPQTGFNDVDECFDQFFSAAFWIYMTSLIFSAIKQPWITFALSLEGAGLLAVSVALGLRRFRVYAYLILTGMAGIFILENIRASSDFLKWLIIATDVLVFFGIYFTVKYLSLIKRIDRIFDKEEAVVFGAGILLLIFAAFQYVGSQWITLSLGISGVAIILIGILNKDKTERLGGLLLLGLTFLRVVLVDLSGLDIIFKIITFIVLGILFLGISFIYNRSSFSKV